MKKIIILMVIVIMLFFYGTMAMAECEAEYQQGYQNGAQQCVSNPALCGIIIGDTNGNGKIGLEDIIYSLQVLIGQRDASCSLCECDSYNNSHPCECNEEYANLHSSECKLTFETIVGKWKYKGTDPEDSTRIWEGVRTFYADGKFEDEGKYNKGDLVSDKTSGTWSFINNELKYLYHKIWLNFSNGTSQYCWTTAWPNGICDNNESYTFAEATAAVEGNTHKFILTQSNNWVVTFIRK